MPERRKLTRPEIIARANQGRREAAARRREGKEELRQGLTPLEKWRRRQTLLPSGKPSIIDFTTDVLNLTLSPAQTTLLKTLYGEPLTDDEFAIFQQCTGRKTYPAREFGEATIISGARSGKDSRFVIPVTVYDLAFGDYAQSMSPGEPTRVTIVAPNKDGAQVAFEYLKAAYENELLQDQIVERPGRGRSAVTSDEIRLRSGIIINCFACTKASTRGWSIPIGIMDELAFFRLEGSADSDVEIETSIRRGQIAFPGSKLLKISTPYMKSGVVYENFKEFFGTDSEDVLVWQSTTAQMNPRITEARLARERRIMDSARFRREYEATFAEDLSAFLSDAWIDAAVESGRSERAPQDGIKYVAAVDPSGGGDDAFALAIVHAEGRRVVQDLCRAWTKPRDSKTNLEGAVEQIASLLKSYRVNKVHGDRYAGAWPREAFHRQGITFEDAKIYRNKEWVYLDRSQAYLEMEPQFAQGTITILDNAQQTRELRNLERRPSQGGKDKVDHPLRQHDDRANTLALASALAVTHTRESKAVVSSVTMSTTGEFWERNQQPRETQPIAQHSECGGRCNVNVLVDHTRAWLECPYVPKLERELREREQPKCALPGCPSPAHVGKEIRQPRWSMMDESMIHPHERIGGRGRAGE